MYNKVFKNYQVNVGNPFPVKTPVNYNNIKVIKSIEKEEDSDNKEQNEESKDEIINGAREEAEAILKEAQYEALRLIEGAQHELESLRMEVEEQARSQGYEEGYTEVKKQYEDKLAEAEFIRESAKIEYNNVVAGIEADMVNLILDIAKSVIGSEFSTNKENIFHLVKQALSKCANREKICIKVSSEDFEYIDSHKEQILSMVEGIDEFEIKKDLSLKTGSCIVETPYGSIDAGMETKFKKIEEAFLQIVGK